MNRIFLAFVIWVFITLGFPLFASWVEPPAYRVQGVPYSEFFLRDIKSEQTVEVRRSRDFGLHWKAKINDYDELFSDFRLSPDGKFLVHIKGNHMVQDVDQVCVEIYQASGLRDTYKVREFMKSLRTVPPENRNSLSPRYVWCIELKDPSDEMLVLRVADKRYAWISLGAHKVDMHGEAEPNGAANGSQPIRSETNRMSTAAGSRR
jgi:hypothetical protein